MKQGLIFVKEFYVVVPYYVNEQDTDQIKKPWRSKFMDTLNAKDDVETIVSRYRNFVKGQKMLNTRIPTHWLKITVSPKMKKAIITETGSSTELMILPSPSPV